MFLLSCNGKGKWGNGAYADFKIYGNITDSSNVAISNAKVSIYQVDSQKNITLIETVDVDETGYYSCVKHNYSGERTMRIVCKPTDNNFLSDSIDIVIKPTGGDGSWYEGTAASACDFKLKSKN